MKIAFFGVKEQDKKDYYLKNLPDHKLVFLDSLDEDHLPDETDFEIISVFVGNQINHKVIDHFPVLKFIAVRSTGVDNIDLKHAQEKGIKVSNVPAYGSHTVAEFTFALILTLTRNVTEGYNRTKQDKKFNYEGLRGTDLFKKTLGVIGTGKIGANVIKMAKGFGMEVLAYDLYPNRQLVEELDFSYVLLDDLMKRSDIITLHTPATPETTHLINQKNIYNTKKGAIFVNTSRGQLIETEALINALESGQISQAGLDVLEDENIMNQNMESLDEKELTIIKLNQKLISMSQVIVTPHMAFYTKEAEQQIMETTVSNILSFVNGIAVNIVNG